MKSKYKYMGIFAGIVAIVGVILFFKGFNFLNIGILKSDVTNNSSQKQADAPDGISQENKILDSSSRKTDDNIRASDAEILPRYYSQDYNFFFDAPKGFRFTEIPDDNGGIVLVEGGAGESFQIFITLFDEPGPLTPERIKKDIPQKIIQNPRSATLDGVKAIAFSSREEGAGDIFEIWFVHNGSLYQITTKAGFSDKLQNILQSWKFY